MPKPKAKVQAGRPKRQTPGEVEGPYGSRQGQVAGVEKEKEGKEKRSSVGAVPSGRAALTVGGGAAAVGEAPRRGLGHDGRLNLKGR